MRTAAVTALACAAAVLTVAPLPSLASDRAEPSPERHYRPNESPYRVYPLLDASVIVVGGAVALTPNLLVLESLRPECGLECERSDVNAFDRVAVDLRSDAARTASDILFFASMGMPLVANAIDVAISSPHDGWGGYAVDTVVFLETLGVSETLGDLAITLHLGQVLSGRDQRDEPLSPFRGAPDLDQLQSLGGPVQLTEVTQ